MIAEAGGRADVERLQRRYAPDLLRDPAIRFVDKTFPLWVALGLWGGGVRTFVVHHVTYSINSLCHTFDRRAFDTGCAAGSPIRRAWVISGLDRLGLVWKVVRISPGVYTSTGFALVTTRPYRPAPSSS